MRACIEGVSPPAANARMEKDNMRPATIAFKKKISMPLLEGIDWAMEIDPLHRPQNVAELLEVFDKEVETELEEESTLQKIANSIPWIK